MEHIEFQDRTPFYWACTTEDLRMVDYLCKSGCNINHQSKLGRTALTKACYLGRIDIVKYLISLPDIKLNLIDNKGK